MKYTINDFRLKDLEHEELKIVLNWRNKPEIRDVMFNRNPISLDDHLKWFENCRENPNNKVKIFYIKDQPIGIINFKVESANNICFWGFYIGEEIVPRGTGTIMGFLALDYIFNQKGLNKVCAEVLSVNNKSLRYHEKIGFKKEGILKDQIYRDESYIDLHLYGLLNDEWRCISSDIKQLVKELIESWN